MSFIIQLIESCISHSEKNSSLINNRLLAIQEFDAKMRHAARKTFPHLLFRFAKMKLRSMHFKCDSSFIRNSGVHQFAFCTVKLVALLFLLTPWTSSYTYVTDKILCVQKFSKAHTNFIAFIVIKFYQFQANYLSFSFAKSFEWQIHKYATSGNMALMYTFEFSISPHIPCIDSYHVSWVIKW